MNKKADFWDNLVILSIFVVTFGILLWKLVFPDTSFELVILIVFSAIAVGLIILAVRHLVYEERKSCTIKVLGTVVEKNAEFKDISGGFEGAEYRQTSRTVYRFTTFEGETVESETKGIYGPFTPKVGDTVHIRYNPDNPSSFIVKEDKNLIFVLLILTLFVAIPAIIAVIYNLMS